jgi:CheY-like chemotaxis protein
MKMKKKNILVVSNQDASVSPLAEWTNAVDTFSLNIADSDEKAIELFHQQHFDLVVVDNTDSAINVNKLQALLPILQEDVPMLGYNGESAFELDRKVEATFDILKFQRLQRMMLLDSSMYSSPWTLDSFSLN